MRYKCYLSLCTTIFVLCTSHLVFEAVSSHSRPLADAQVDMPGFPFVHLYIFFL